VGRNRAVVAQNVLVKHIKECHDYEATRCRIKDCLGVTLWDTHKKLTVHETSHSSPPRKCSRANCNSEITLRTSPLSWSVQWESIRLLERMQMPWCQISLPPERSTLGMFKGISFIPQSTWGLSVELQELIRRQGPSIEECGSNQLSLDPHLGRRTIVYFDKQSRVE
jgi:hypothetical protein